MTPDRPTFRSGRDGSASIPRILLTLFGVLVAVGLAGWAVVALANAFAGPDTSVVETATIAPVAVEPPVTSTVAAEEPAPAAAPAVSASTKPAEPAPAPVAAAPAPAPAPAASSSSANGEFVVVIDAGHQAKGDNKPEPIGPGASETKPSVTSGATGSTTKKLESQINLEVAKRVQKELEAAGVKVIMVRTSQNVNISNSKRAAVANKANADLLLRLHCDDVDNSSTNGLMTMVPAKNRWTGPIVEMSAKAGKDIHAAAIKATGAKSRGIVKTASMSGFNWSEVPAVIVEMGVMSNPAEDKKLASAAYQEKLATGISNGVVKYLNSTR